MFPDNHALNQAIYNALRAALLLSPEEASSHLFRAYSNPPPVEPTPSENVCYYYLRTDPNPAVLQETFLESDTPEVFSFIPCTLTLVCYGPDCEAWAHRLQSFLFLDGAGEPRQLLRSAGLFPIPSRRPPSILFEESGKTFRKRADLVIPLRLRSNESYKPLPTIDVPPTVMLHYS